MRDPERGTAQQPADRLQGGPSRPPWFEKVPASFRQPAVILLALVLGIVTGGGAAMWWQARPEPRPARADEHAVELVLFDVVPPRTWPGAGKSDLGPLHVEAALLMTGGATSTVTGIGAPNGSLTVRAPALPVEVSPSRRFHTLELSIFVRDCDAASRWTPADRPFTITWRDQYGQAHLDRAGDFGRSVTVSLTRYIDAGCDRHTDG